MNWDEVRDGQGKLLGRVSDKNYMGVRQVVAANGQTLGWSKSASDLGGLPYTVDNRGRRVSHGEHPELLFRQKTDDTNPVLDFHAEQYARMRK